MKAILWLIGGWLRSLFIRNKTIKLIALTTLLGTIAYAASMRSATITLAWDANLEPDLAGYKLYSAPAGSTNFTQVGANITNGCTVVVSNLTTVAQFYVTAYNTSTMESQPSNILVVNPNPPCAPGRVRLQYYVITKQ